MLLEHIKKTTSACQCPKSGRIIVLRALQRRDEQPCWCFSRHYALTKTEQELDAQFSQISAGKDQLCALRSALGEKCQAGGKAISRTPMCWKGKWIEWSLEGENPFKSMRNSARKQQKEQFGRNYREEKKTWQEIEPERWSTSFWAKWMFQLKMTELRSFKSSQILINSSWMEAARILKSWQTLFSG